jgi:putative endonuclease
MQRRTPLRMRVAARWRRKLPAFVRVRRMALRRWCSLGARGERAAIQYLENQFFHVWQTNVWINGGEIDIIASTKRELVFVEVKTRVTSSLGPPYLSVTRQKARHIVNSALAYLKRYGLVDSPWRIDVASVKLNMDYALEHIEIIENAVEGDYL